MAKLKMFIGAGGAVRAVFHDDFADLFRKLGFNVPKRASHVEIIQTGPNAGRWYADMSPLGEDFGYCLWPPFDTRREALAAEVAHIEERWIRGSET